ncbi:STE20-related kinase adapter protein stlk [Eurosta solidaginis]|uniref:STE20-related kinase adapter protein stlk n=1 Tax=Eurosta solidaginis TaxID=178769 RepID=UPI0035314115
MFGYNPKDYDLKVELSRCFNSIGTVYLAQYIPNGQHVAVKKYRMDKASKEESLLARDELLVMRQFNHPNIHTFHTSFVYGSELFQIAPLMCFGSCKDTIANCFRAGFPEIFVALIMRDVLTGLEYLHRRGYIHRSIRASHILLNQTKAVLSGFRECTSIVAHGQRIGALHQLAACSQRSLNWLAPEVLEQNIVGYTEKSDIYSIGITCCELANGVEPFADAQPTFMFTEKLRGNVPTLLDRSTCPASEEMIEMVVNHDSESIMQAQQIYCQRIFSDEFHQMTEICMVKRPSSRWSALQLLSHTFFKQCRHTSILDQLQRFSLETKDYSKIRDESLGLCNDLSEMNVHSNDWDWDF